MVEGFESIAKAGVQNFESLFQEDNNFHLPKVVKSAWFFPTSISEVENVELMKGVTMQELKSILDISKNDKSLGPNGIPIEVYRSLFDVLGEDLLRFVEDSRQSIKIPFVFNSTFITLIPKVDHPNTFEDFRPISLCNYIYKVIGKSISIRIRKVLGHYISGE